MKSTAAFLLLVYTTATSATLQAQENAVIPDPGHVSHAFGLQMAGNGNAAFYRLEKRGAGATYPVLDAEFSSLRHYKEVKITNVGLGPDANYFKYGKMNRAFLLRTMAGIGYTVAERNDRKNLAFGISAAAGLNLTGLIPVYVRILEQSSFGDIRQVTERYNPETQNQNLILGTAPLSKGFGEISNRLGYSAKAGIDIRWGNYQSDFRRLGVGMLLDGYGSPLPLMYKKNKSVFTSFYVNFAFGFKN